VGHLRAKGFEVKTNEVGIDESYAVKKKHGVPRNLWSCHTGIVEGYVIEGHVPGEVISRLLKEKPAVAGVGVPGMPTGSPGMEGANARPYDVFTFDKKGRVKVYARINP
jgi:hypothetical protein